MEEHDYCRHGGSRLLEKGMSKKFMVDTVACATYVLNRCPMKSVPKKTPEEV